VSLVARGAFVCTTLLAASACSTAPVAIDDPDLSDQDRAACEAFVAALPDDLVEQEAAETEPDDALGAAWGDPPIVVRCGVPMPDDFNRASPCEEVNGVGWFVRPEEFQDSGKDLAMFTIGFEPAVELDIPAEHRVEPATVADALSVLSAPVKTHLRRVSRCA